MPLVRVQVRNEYGLGQYREANGEDPKAVLDGVTVAGLVGVLRQLGDLVEFAAEVFHGLQEHVMTTSSRSHKLMVRVQHIEAALPPLERVILAQKSHLHFAYAAGSDWHAHLESEQNHFIYSDLPHFIMDSYEECRDPPRLHLLDKFDTGGPGSCIKRFSDPTIFRRASGSPGEANVECVSKSRKAHKSKKKRTWQRNEVSHDASISNHDDRTQFVSLKVDEQISPSHTASAFNGTLKSELGDQSNSFNSKTGSGYVECIFHPAYSLNPEEREPKESSFSSLMIQSNDPVDSTSVDELSRVEEDDIHCRLTQEQTGPYSSCVTWDEKTEIVESTGNWYNRDDETAEMHTVSCHEETQGKGAVNFRYANQMDYQCENVDKTMSIYGLNQAEDIESEPEIYMDARTQDGMNELSPHHLNRQPSNLESNNPGYISSNEVTSYDKPNFISSESSAHEESPQMAGEFSNITSSLDMDFCGNNNILGGSNVQSDVSNLPYSCFAESNPEAPMSDQILSSACNSHKSPIEPSGVQSVNFWTNGGLLGLEPSKPPDFRVLNAVTQDSLTRSKDDTTIPSDQSNILNGNGDVDNPYKLTQSSKSIEQISPMCSTSCFNARDGFSSRKTSWRLSSTDFDAKSENYVDSLPSNSFNDNHGHSSSENASQTFGPSNRFLVNIFQRNLMLVDYKKSESHSSRKTGLEDKSRNRSVAYQTLLESPFEEPFESGSPTNSPPPSPPLQHMKISFQPIAGFETSKLTLKFPNGGYCPDSSRDVLPSFQLVPQPATPHHDICSDSGVDTFCRSSPYMSDDSLSHHSDSDSEQWESDYNSPSKENEPYDALRGTSSTDSVSISLEREGTGHGNILVNYGLRSPYGENCPEPCQSVRSPYLPSLSILNPLFEQEMQNNSDGKGLSKSNFLEELTSLPPPLPPLQWRVTKTCSDVTVGNRISVSEELNRAFGMKTLCSAISPQSKPIPIKHQQNIDEATVFTTKSKPGWQKTNEHQEIHEAINGRGIDEKDHLLHQIRTKSFSLRRTTAENSSATPEPTANVKVTAILEKANAIRQAVGSDDDSWSDT
ncbi:protein SCAR3-like [Actinidia eriantha]|uniref:protein SCAR3-like n=1 Tax=Actinidia eriantha TaxID=165200 RepID=UPI002584F923|nr:protein SCAR3-like [Actinidia eriantha]